MWEKHYHDLTDGYNDSDARGFIEREQVEQAKREYAEQGFQLEGKTLTTEWRHHALEEGQHLFIVRIAS